MAKDGVQASGCLVRSFASQGVAESDSRCSIEKRGLVVEVETVMSVLGHVSEMISWKKVLGL